MITKDLFFGIEVEGPYRGLQTLFVPFSAFREKQSLIEYIAPTVQQIYFNAGEDYGNSEQLLHFTEKLAHEHNIIVTIEFDKIYFPQGDRIIFPKNVNVVLAVTGTPPTAVKFIKQDRLQWYILADPISNRLNDPLYNEDFEARNDKK